MTQQSSPAPFIKINPTKAITVNAGNPIVFSQPLVDKGIVRSEEVKNALVLFQQALKEKLSLHFKGSSEIFIELREHQRVWINPFDVPEMEPLPGKILDKR